MIATHLAPAGAGIEENPLSHAELQVMDAWWRAANYLSVGQIYLLDNPLLREPLTLEHIKPRLLGHWGTTPGLNLIYAHLNRVIRKYDLNAIYIAGPGHGGPGLVANNWLDGTYSEFYPNISRDLEGMKRLFTQFSFPAGSPVTSRPRLPGRFTKAENWAIRWRTPLARSSTIPICWPAAWLATEKPKPGLWPPVGIPTNSSIPPATARCCRFCT